MTTTLLPICLVLHLTGLLLMAGLTIADIISFSLFWRTYETDRQKGILVMSTMGHFQKFMIGGGLLLILTGVGMMALTHGIFGEQLWMRVKISIVVLLAINGPVLARPALAKLQSLLKADVQNDQTFQQVMSLKTRITWIQVANLLFFATIIILSIFKFN